MSNIATKNFVFYFFFVFATIAPFSVFCLDFGAKVPSRRDSAKSKSHAFNNFPFQTYKYEHQTVGTPSVVPHYSFLSFFHHSLFPDDTMAPFHLVNQLFLSCFPISLYLHPVHFTPINPIAASTQSCRTKHETLLPSVNPTERLCVSESVRISIKICCGARFVVSFHVQFDTFTL